MSTGPALSHRSKSSQIKPRKNAISIAPKPTLTPENEDREFEPCAATASYFLYAQRDLVLCLHHDTLAIERRFDRHREDVRWIAADTVSERGAGRLAVSYDAGHTAIVWDIATGDEIARFAAYEEIRVATWMRNGNIAFGNVQGNVILFEPSTSEHISARTIYDPITAIAPVADNRTFAIGYLNGSILIATLQPFTMVHSLNTSNTPSRITGLAWHGSATRQKSDMLATQTADGNLKVWSIPKVANGDSPNIIRILNRPDGSQIGPCWFGWSKLGRIVQHSGGETRAWDVRTKNVTYETVPTLDGIVGIANCGPTCALFTLGSNHTVQQYDIKPGEKPMQVASVQHAPANTPPSPPNSIEEQKGQGEEAIATLPTLSSIPVLCSDAETSEGEDMTMSPLQRIAKEMDQLEEESRDRVGPLSPLSSRASSVSSSRSSERSRRAPSYRYDKPGSSRASNVSVNEGTEFSFGQPIRQPVRESISVRSTSSFNSSKYRSSGLRKEVLHSPNEAPQGSHLELFPFVKARLGNVPFRRPHYGEMARTPDVMRREMLSVVFGWNDDIEHLIRDELVRHSPASTSGVLLSQWLGELGADSMASMVGSESMTSSDWMLLALSSMGHGSQKQVGEAFVHRLLEKGDVHPAVAILLGLHDENDAVEVYVSRNYFMEAVLLTCLVFPSDWQRQSHLVRQWGEALVAQGQPELAVRCFSCTSIDISDSWLSPRAQDAFFVAREKQEPSRPILSPPLSPPSATESSRLRSRLASLKVITTFGDNGVPVLVSSSDRTPMANNLGVTPIAESAISPGGVGPWIRAQRKERDPSSARTATPGAYSRKRLPSESVRHRDPLESTRSATKETPLTAAKDFNFPPAAHGSLDHPPRSHRSRSSSISSRDRASSLGSLSLQYDDRRFDNPEHLPSPAHDVFARLKDRSTARNGSRERLPIPLQVHVYDTTHIGSRASPQPQSLPGSGICETRKEMDNVDSRVQSHQRDLSESRGRAGARYVRPAKRSPSSPIPMSPEEVAAATRAMARKTSGGPTAPESAGPTGMRASSSGGNRAPSRQRKPNGEDASTSAPGLTQDIEVIVARQSPSPPLQRSPTTVDTRQEEVQSNSRRMRSRQRSSSRKPQDLARSNEVTSPIQRSGAERSRSRIRQDLKDDSALSSAHQEQSVEALRDLNKAAIRNQESLIRKRIAARELEERRASLARRPSAPVIPLPGESPSKRPPMAPRFHTELGDSPHTSVLPVSGIGHERSHTADPHDMMRFVPRLSGIPGASPGIGLPATPRAMRNPYYMSADSKDNERVPDVPDLPYLSSEVFRQPSLADTESDNTTPLLPSTVYSPRDQFSPQRAASVPLERAERPAGISLQPSVYKMENPALPNRQGTGNRSHSRRTSLSENRTVAKRHSPPPVRASIDETLHEAQVVIIEAPDADAIVLPELRHLATPPPPPPPPMFTIMQSASNNDLGVIDIAIDEGGAPMVIDVAPNIDRAATTSPSTAMKSHRRGRNSISEGLGQRLRHATGMRSTSRPRVKSPLEPHMAMPYETVLPRMPSAARHESQARVKSPYEGSEQHHVDQTSGCAIPPEGISLPPSRSGSVLQGQRYANEIRANMPPETLQQGVYKPDNNMV